MRLAQPWLLALALPLALFVLLRLRSLPPSQVGARRRFVQATWAMTVVCATVAVGGLEVGRSVERMALIFVIDRSRSVSSSLSSSGAPGTEAEDTDALEEVRDAMQRMHPDDAAGVVVFGSRAATERLPSPLRELGPLSASVPREGTDLEAALRRALADLPDAHATRLVLLSDGNATHGDVMSAAEAAAARGVAVDVFPLERENHADIAIESVRAPAQVEGEEPVEVRIVTRSSQATSARLMIDRDGAPFAEAEVQLPAGEDVFIFRDRDAGAGLHHYEVSLVPEREGQDASPLNNTSGAFTRVVGPARVLVVGGVPSEAQPLAEAVERGGIDVELIGSETLPMTLSELGSYDAILLSDVNARALSESQMQALAAYVRDFGGGLAMFGAHDAFGLGGYAYTDIEEVLPATFDLRRRRDRLSLAMVIAIDRSGSMGVEVDSGRTKLDLANEAAARSALLLSVQDRVGVMHVDTEVHWTQPMTTVDNPERIASTVRSATAGGGGIYVDVTLEASYAALRQEETQLRHLLLFSDGDDSEEMMGAAALVRMAASVAGGEITTSVVSMGNGIHTAALERLSTLGGGRFYIVEDLTELPRIFTQETIEASRSVLRREPTSVASVERGPPTEGIDFGGAPQLLGYSVVNARTAATQLLVAGESDPLLLTWQRGLGRSAVFASDVGARYATPWLGWEGFAPLMSQLTRDLARANQDAQAQVRVSLAGGQGRVVVESVDTTGRYRNHLPMRANVAGPHGRSESLELTQTGPGRYEAEFRTGAPGPYLVTASEGDRLLSTAGAVLTAADELRASGSNHALLAQIAAVTGGQLRTRLSEAVLDRPPPVYAYDSLWEWALMLAMLSMLASVAGRRLVLPRLRRRAATAGAPQTQNGSQNGPSATLAEELLRARAVRPNAAQAGGSPPTSQPPTAGRPQTTSAPPTNVRAAGPKPTPDASEPAGAAGPTSLAERLLANKKKDG